VRAEEKQKGGPAGRIVVHIGRCKHTTNRFAFSLQMHHLTGGKEQMESKLTRREFIKLSSVAAAGLAIAACTKTEEPTKAPEATAAPVV
jgi:hypothetical protein